MKKKESKEILNKIKEKKIFFNQKKMQEIKNIEKTYKKNVEVYFNGGSFIKSLVFIMIGRFMTFSQTLFKFEEQVERSTELANVFTTVGQLATLMLTFGGLIFLMIGIFSFYKAAHDPQGGGSYSEEKINEEKLNKLLNNPKEITNILEIKNLKEINEKLTNKTLLKNLSKECDNKFKKEKEEVNKLCIQYIELYKDSTEKAKLLNQVKNLIAENEKEYEFLKDLLFNKIIDLQKDIEFKKQKTDKKVFVSSI